MDVVHLRRRSVPVTHEQLGRVRFRRGLDGEHWTATVWCDNAPDRTAYDVVISPAGDGWRFTITSEGNVRHAIDTRSTPHHASLAALDEVWIWHHQHSTQGS